MTRYDDDRSEAERCVEAGVEVAAQHTVYRGLRFRDIAEAERGLGPAIISPHRIKVSESTIEEIAEALDLTLAEARALMD